MVAASGPGMQPPLGMRRDPGQPLHPAPELLAVDEAGGITEISMPITTPGPGRTWLVTRPEDIRAVLGDHELFSNVLHLPAGGPGGTVSPTGPGSLLGLDPPQHTRLRRLLSAEFSARRVASLRAAVEATVQGALAEIRGQDRADLVTAVAEPVPAVAIAELLGVPSADRDEFCRSSKIALDTRLPALARAENRAGMQAYMGQLVTRLRRESGDGLLGALITRHGPSMSDADLIATGNMLLIAGHETTASLISQSLLLLLEYPRHREAMLRDEDSLARGVEELLRYLTVFHFSLPRTARRPTVVAGARVEAGDRIFCSFPVANRDRRRYPDADEFQPLRGIAPHLAFGHGIHYCLGAPLARLEMRTVLPAFFESFPAAEIDPRSGVRYRDGSLTFGLEALPVTLRRVEAAVGQAERPAPDAGHTFADPSAILVAEPCPVPFQGCSRRSGNISWAQQLIWESVSRGLAEGRSTNYDLRFSADVPAGTTVDDFLAAIGRMVSRHEALRTRFEYGDGRLVRQEAAGSGYVDVTRYQARAGHVPTDELLRSRVGREMLDIGKSYPFRVGFVAAAGIVTHAAFAISLIIADAGACDSLISSFLAELSAIRNGTNARLEPVFQQLDQAGWEASADGLRAERQASGYWREQMAAIQALPRPAILDGGTIRCVVVPAESILTAAGEVARMSATSSSAAILTAFLQAAAQILGLEGLGCYLHCSNRSDPERRGSITRLKNVAVFAYSPGCPDFRSAVREVFRDSLNAYRHAQSPGGLFLRRLGTSPGNAPFIEFNDVRSVVVMEGPAEPVQQADPGAEADPGQTVTAEIPSLDSHNDSHNPAAVLTLGVGPIVGVGPLEHSAKPFLRVETNILSADGISLLLTRMHRILTAADMVMPAE